MIAKALEEKDEQHKQEMDERLAQQKEEMEEHFAQQRDEHRLDMETITRQFTAQRDKHRLDIEAITRRFAAQMVAYDARFQLLEGATIISSEQVVTTERGVHDLGSSARPIVKSSADITQGNNQAIFYYQFIRRSSSVIEYHDNEQ